jgi:hypothetical protein
VHLRSASCGNQPVIRTVQFRIAVRPGRCRGCLPSSWQGQFIEFDLKTTLPPKLTFSDPEKIRELARRGEAWGDSESRQMLEDAIDVGRGEVYLRLTPEQYRKVRKPP